MYPKFKGNIKELIATISISTHAAIITKVLMTNTVILITYNGTQVLVNYFMYYKNHILFITLAHIHILYSQQVFPDLRLMICYSSTIQ